MTNGQQNPVAAAFHLVGMEVFGQAPDRFPAECSLHATYAAVTEISNHGTMTVVFLLSKLIKPLLYQRGYAALLSPDPCVV
jgi:hypothetical protein